MATAHSRGIAAQAWCDPRTSHLIMEPELAEVFAEKLDKYKEAIIWMSGAPAFAPEGEAWQGWQMIRDTLLKNPDSITTLGEVHDA